jgi:uncharacterized protein (DUF1330 family)
MLRAADQGAVFMKGYAVGHLRSVNMGPAIVEYLERIDASLAPFGGRFLVHGAKPEVLEGAFPGDLVVIEFQSLDRAKAWYESRAYQALLPLRTENAESTVILVEGCDETHRATDIIPK